MAEQTLIVGYNTALEFWRAALQEHGDPVEASDLDESHWAYNELNRACQDGWLTVENGQLRPDDPITYAEISGALSALSAELAA